MGEVQKKKFEVTRSYRCVVVYEVEARDEEHAYDLACNGAGQKKTYEGNFDDTYQVSEIAPVDEIDYRHERIDRLANKMRGGPFIRGAADCRHGREYKPHYFKSGSILSDRVEADQMTVRELKQYAAGWARSEKDREQKMPV